MPRLFQLSIAPFEISRLRLTRDRHAVIRAKPPPEAMSQIRAGEHTKQMPEDEHSEGKNDANKHAGGIDDVELAREHLYTVLEIDPRNVESKPKIKSSLVRRGSGRTSTHVSHEKRVT
jgi:hypothetical protein